MITLKLDVTKIDKAKLFAGKNGAKYLDIVLFERDDAYGNNFMVVQSVSKEERQAGKRGAILGNGKYVGERATPAPARRAEERSNSEQSAGDEDCPF